MVNTDNAHGRTWRWMGLLFCVFALKLHAQTVREEAVLLDKPEGKPGAVKVTAGSPVKALRRQGFWVEVDAAGKVGWLKVSQLNFAGATGGPTAIDTGRLGTGNIVATSVARGLSAKDLISGQPNYDEANKLDALNVQPQAVQSFLLAGGVVAINEKIQLVAPRPAAAPSAEHGNETGIPAPSKKKDNEDW